MIRLSEGERNPGPNGFNMGFYKKFWDTLKEDITNLVNEFYGSATLPKAITTSFLILIAKHENP